MAVQYRSGRTGNTLVALMAVVAAVVTRDSVKTKHLMLKCFNKLFRPGHDIKLHPHRMMSRA